MKLDQLYFFDSIARNKSIRAAGKELFTTPQNISRSIKLLEEELGEELFDRTTSGMELTESGEKAYEYIKKALFEVNALKKEFNSKTIEHKSITNPVEIQANPAIEAYVSSMYNIISKAFTDTPVVINQCFHFSSHVLQQTRTPKEFPDIVVTGVPFEELTDFTEDNIFHYDIYYMFTDALCLQCPKNSVYAQYDSISIKMLCDIPLLLFNYSPDRPTKLNKILSERGLKLKNVSSSSNISTCSIMAQAQGRCCLVGYPSVEYRPLANVDYIPIDENMNLEYLLLLKRRTDNPLFLEAFSDMICEHFDTKLVTDYIKQKQK